MAGRAWLPNRFENMPSLLKDLVLPLVMTLNCLEPDSRDLVLLEIMAGQAEITEHTSRLVGPAMPFDLSYGSGMDICTDHGFALLLRLVLRLREQAVCWAAPCCSSWVWVGRNGTGRSKTQPAGDDSVPRVARGTEIAQRCCQAMLVAWLRGEHVRVEQPPSSLMFEWEPYRLLAEHVTTMTTKTYLGAFGGRFLKQVVLRHSTLLFSSLERRRPASTDLEPTVKRGKWVTNLGNNVSESQAYPPLFGQCVAEIFRSLHQQQGIRKYMV